MAKVIRMKGFSELNGWTVVPLSGGDLDDFAARGPRRLLDVLSDDGTPRLVVAPTAVGFVVEPSGVAAVPPLFPDVAAACG
ncbi:hypothetical protein PUR71_29845 [Streptomyces sp. SP17BM10]|uniref:hypothetical protein n=1 Tax=Streptomyces sp. SP17BM10 TaxID=3002530 RepID=UPI002E7A3206|nr:hypothetical protein [Streptomyces sp. SP17BM10]MEE1787077.1 hypothetical protein [Streptomyces sp. SP17BM10]